jgi:hypothetical protein
VSRGSFGGVSPLKPLMRPAPPRNAAAGSVDITGKGPSARTSRPPRSPPNLRPGHAAHKAGGPDLFLEDDEIVASRDASTGTSSGRVSDSISYRLMLVAPRALTGPGLAPQASWAAQVLFPARARASFRALPGAVRALADPVCWALG